eukprot:gene2602-biopygen3534
MPARRGWQDGGGCAARRGPPSCSGGAAPSAERDGVLHRQTRQKVRDALRRGDGWARLGRSLADDGAVSGRSAGVDEDPSGSCIVRVVDAAGHGAGVVTK